jgi:serine/threonine protein kinase
MAAQSIGRYRILRELGRGATATVYLARDPGSGRQVAVKILAPAFTAAPDFADRFEQTLKALVALEHPYLLSPHDYGRDEEQFFVVMRYLPGGTLADRMDGRPMLLAEVVPLLQRLAEALDAAHTAHLLHGDIHPADVLFDLHERAVLADLGLAQLLDPVAGPSPTGTAAYMSPEQIAGQPIDGRADVYALGIVLFEMLTGRQPYSGATPQELLRQHLEQPVPQLSAAALAHLVLPLEFNQVIARALAKNRDYRYPTAGVLAEAVRTTFLMAPADSNAEAEPPRAPPLLVETPRRAAPPLLVETPRRAAPPVVPMPPVQELVETPRRGVSPPAASAPSAALPVASAPPIVPPAAPDAMLIAAPGAPVPAPALDSTAPPGGSPPPQPIPPADDTLVAGGATPEPIPQPAAVPPIAATAEAPEPPELVREPMPVARPLRRGPAPGSLLLGLAGIAVVVVFLLLARSPNLRAVFIAPTATPTASASPTVTPSDTATSSATPSATASATPSSTTTATASPTFTPSVTATPSDTPLPSTTPTPTRTPTRPPTLLTFTPTRAPSDTPGASPGAATSGATQSHLGPPPSVTP